MTKQLFAVLLLVGCSATAPEPIVSLVPMAPVRLRVAIMANAADARVPTVREAIAHWNSELARLGLDVKLDSGTVISNVLSDAEMRAASDEVLAGTFGPNVTHLRTALTGIPAEVVVALSNTDLISFALSWGADRQGIVILRTASVEPLSLPNTVRNVAAHELGHVFGLPHNSDPTTLMCGRPSSCRPDAFASSTPRFFPLIAADENLLRQRQWP